MRLIIVSNRLPVTVVDCTENCIAKQSIGGLATGLNTFLKRLGNTEPLAEYMWFGWPGADVSSNNEKKISDHLSKIKCIPIFINESVMKKFNDGFCNKTLWPNFHYFTSFYSYKEEQWGTYKKVNQLFFDKISQNIQPHDIVWIHDYHLLLLPGLLRKRFPDITIGFFLHIPFPSYEMFQMLPIKCRNELLKGMLGANQIGFHTLQYVHHFTECVTKFLGWNIKNKIINFSGREVLVKAYPMSVDYDLIQNKAAANVNIANNQKILKKVKKKKIILSIDRLDYTKGIPNRLYAYEHFLKENPQWQKKVVLVLLVAPSREGVSCYRKMKRQIDELVGRINGQFGEIDWMPIIYKYRTFTFFQLIELFSDSDIALITPLRDGMNLIAKEYICAKLNKKGTLILSEAAGAAQELANAILVNPNCIEEISSALLTALEMPVDEQSARIEVMQEYLKHNNIMDWGMRILNELQSIKINKNSRVIVKFDTPEEIISNLQNSNSTEKKLLLLDYDGTLVPFGNNPQQASPSEIVLRILTTLADNPNNKIVIISGRDRHSLDEWLGKLNIDIVAEHGVWVKNKNKWNLSTPLIKHWEVAVTNIFDIFVDKLPGSFIEKKDFCLAWHYRNTDESKSTIVVNELLTALTPLIITQNIKILSGKKVIEVMCAEMGKDIAVKKYLHSKNYNMILAIGDDVTDEDMFSALPAEAHSIKIGSEKTIARYRLRVQSEVLTLLNSLL